MEQKVIDSWLEHKKYYVIYVFYVSLSFFF